jgi:DNA-directed RNA polymerase subunit L
MTELTIKVGSLSPIECAEQVIKLETASKKIDEKLKELKEKLLQVTKDQGVLTLKTEGYTITRATRDTLKISDHVHAAFELDQMNVPVLTEIVLSDSTKKVLKELIKQGKKFESAEITSTEYIAIRVARGDK